MKIKNKKIFLGLINYGTQAGMLSESLRKNGYKAFSASYKDPFKRKIDIQLLSGGSIIVKMFKQGINLMLKCYWFFKYDHFHFFFGQTLFVKQIDLPFYKMFGKTVVMEYLGWDVQLYQYSIDKYEITNAATYKDLSPEVQRKQDVIKIQRLNNQSKYLNKQYVCAPYISEFVPNSEVLPLGLNLNEYKYIPKKPNLNVLKLLHAPTSRGNKGSEFIISAVNILIEEGWRIEFDLVENVSHAELMQRYAECDVFVGQILGGWYGTADIEAMAIGRPTVCFFRESYFQYIDYGNKIPLINANPNTIYQVIKDLLENKYDLIEIGRKSRAFVEEIHDVDKIANKLIEDYKKI